MVKKWSIPCPLPHNITSLSGAFKVRTAFLSAHKYSFENNTDLVQYGPEGHGHGIKRKAQEIELTDCEDQRRLHRSVYGN